MLPALTYARRDRLEGALTEEEERAVADGTRDLLVEAAALTRPAPTPEGKLAFREPALPAGRIPVLGVPADGDADAVALQMLGHFSREPLRARVLPAARTGPISWTWRPRGAARVVVDLPLASPHVALSR